MTDKEKNLLYAVRLETIKQIINMSDEDLIKTVKRIYPEESEGIFDNEQNS